MRTLFAACTLALSLLLGWQTPLHAQLTIAIPNEMASHSFSLYQDIGGSGTYEYARTLTFSSQASDGIYYDTDFDVNFGSGYRIWNNTDSVSTTSYVSTSPLQPSWMQLANPGPGHLQIPLAIPAERHGHTFAIVFTASARVYPVVTGALMGREYYDLEGNLQYESWGFFNGRCDTDIFGDWSNASPAEWRLIDLTTHEAANAYTTSPPTGSWGTVGNNDIPIEIRFYVPDIASNYTLHCLSGSLQNLSVQISSTGEYYVIGQAPLFDSIWLTRDVDGASSEVHANLGGPYDARNNFGPYVNRNLVTFSFQIGTERAGHNLFVVHADGFRTPITYSSGGSYLVTWDDNGAQVIYYYDFYAGDVDLYQSSWWVEDDTTGETLGQTYQIFTGFQPMHPNPPSGYVSIMVPAFREGTLRLIESNGEQWNVLTSGSWASYWNYAYSGLSMQRAYEVFYIPSIAHYGTSGNYMVRDTVSGDEAGPFSPGDTIDLSTWYRPRTETIQFRIHESRFGNNLVLVQPHAQELLNKQNVVGGWQYTPTSVIFESGGFFTASATFTSSAPTWLWDATRQEYLNPDPNNGNEYLSSVDATDANNNLVPDWWENAYGLGLQSLDSDGDGLNDFDELTRLLNGVLTPLELNRPDNPIVQLSVTGFVTP
jgi:hypothetical protein